MRRKRGRSRAAAAQLRWDGGKHSADRDAYPASRVSTTTSSQ